MAAGITIRGNTDPRADVAIKINFVANLECDTPAKLCQIILTEAMTNPCLVVDCDDEIDEVSDNMAESSDLAEETALPMDEDFEEDYDTFSDEEIDELEHPFHYDFRYSLNKRELLKEIEDSLSEDEVVDLIEATSESEAEHKEFHQGLEQVFGYQETATSIEPFLSIKKRGQCFDAQVSDLPGIRNLSLNDKLKKIMKDKYMEALDLVTAVRAHREIIQKMADVLINRQLDFFNAPDYQKAACLLKPFSQTDMAKELKLHKSTIARIVQGKVVETDFGYVPLQALFGRKGTMKKGEGDDVPSRVKLQVLKDFLTRADTMPTDPEIQDFFKTKGIRISLEMLRYYRKRLGFYKKRGRRK